MFDTRTPDASDGGSHGGRFAAGWLGSAHKLTTLRARWQRRKASSTPLPALRWLTCSAVFLARRIRPKPNEALKFDFIPLKLVSSFLKSARTLHRLCWIQMDLLAESPH